MPSVTSDTLQRSLAAARRDVRTYKGIGVSPGIAVGRAVIIEKREASVYRVPIRDEEVEAEVSRFNAALEKTRDELLDLKHKVSRSMGDEYAQIFEAHAMIVTGVNLPMIVKFASMAQDAQDLATLAHVISEKGSKAIRVASDLLTAEKRAVV